MRIKAIILAGGEGTRLAILTKKRAKPAVPFAGKYRIIDFTLSNCVNSNIFDVLILTQYRPHSLMNHIGKGRPWDLDRSFTGGVQILQPYKGHFDTDWYAGTADAVAQNMNFVRHGRPEYVLILSGDHIYEMDYDVLIQFHRENEADVTVCTIRVPMEDANRFGILDVDEDYRVKDFVEKPENPPGNLASMGVYVFNYSALEQYITTDQANPDSAKDFGKSIVPAMVEDGMRVFAYPYGGYWIDVGTLDAYWEAHMDLLAQPPSLNLNDRTWIIHTRSEERPPVRIQEHARIKDSLITDGTIVAEGAVVESSVLSPGVYVGPNAVIRESIILNDAYIEAGAVVERCIVDKIAVIGHGAHVGNSEAGITCVGKNAHVPPGYTIGGGCILDVDLRASDFAGFENKTVPDGVPVNLAKNKKK
ncbi:MAG: glucose-1-phosphate adenylyltransferase [Chloroflexi bacterium AL-W]|nr:glucose-1-phosphate adenylyltransferase [Chloroflexi bacterium AL-W]